MQADSEGAVLADLGDGLVLRRGWPADVDQLAPLNADIHRNPGETGPDEGVAIWTHDLFGPGHPCVRPQDFTVVEDVYRGAIVSSMCLIPQTWTYDGLAVTAGRPELVGTHPDYRHRGLIRAQFDVIHRWSAEQGHLLQGITGIPYYYRQFGYEMAVDLGGGRSVPRSLVPRLAPGAAEPFVIRPVGEADLPLIARLDTRAGARCMLYCPRDTPAWRYEALGRTEGNCNRMEVRVIETAAGRPVGMLVYYARLLHGVLSALYFELLPGISYLAVSPAILRYLLAAGDAAAAPDRPCKSVGFTAPDGHPIYAALADRLLEVNRRYAWYLRVPDLPALLRRIRPVLQARLAGSAAAGYSGRLDISFYRSGVRLTFERGKISSVEPWMPDGTENAQARFPGLTFLQLLFGYRDLDELQHAYPDCAYQGDAERCLLTALFPRRPSFVWAVD